MLNDEQLDWLCSQLALTAEALGHAISPAAAAMVAEDLSAYPLAALKRALARVRSEHTGKLTPKVVIERLEVLAGRLSPNEAWALALKAQDQRATVVWTDEIQTAWATAAPVANAGDRIGARMAFIAAYERCTAQAREMRTLPSISVSIGWDSQLRATALEAAVATGLLTHDQAAQHSDSLALPAPAFNPVALLAGKVEVTADAPPELRTKLTELRDFFAGKAKRYTRREVLARAERMKLGKSKRDTAQAVDAYIKGAKA